MSAFKIVLSILLIESISAWYRESSDPDRLQLFYDSLKRSDVKYCEDRTRLLPNCKECIPGLKESGLGAKTCDQFIGPSTDIRNEISKLTHERYGTAIKPNRPFGLYPCKISISSDRIQSQVYIILDLELPDFMTRQEYFGSVLSDMNAMVIPI